MFAISRSGSTFLLVLSAGLLAAAQGERGGGLTLVDSAPREDLNAVVAAATSPDGKFLYAASWQSATIVAFARASKTGKLEHRQTVSSDNLLSGVTSVAVSPDGRHAVACAFQSRAAVLFRRDADSGELTQAGVARDGESGVRFQWPIRTDFSPDSQFAYVIDDHGPDEGGTGSVVTLRVRNDKLELVAIDEGKDGCYLGARGLAIHPDGRTLFVASSRAHALVVADRDPETGKTSVRQVIRDGEGDTQGLAGAMGVAVSPDGRDVYVSAGRFGGDNAVSAFRLASDGRLAPIQEFFNGAGGFEGFEGGNHLAVSPDGLNVYASATLSGSIASFRRDPATGKLAYLGVVSDGGPGGGLGAAGVEISPDSRFVYVATEDKKAVSVFQREGER